MIYIEYVEYKQKYYAAQREYDKVLSEKEELFIKTQPSAVPTDKEVVSGGKPSNAFDDYLIVKEKKKIDERLEEARSILKNRKELLDLKEEKLKSSKNVYDIVYYSRCIENISPVQIGFSIPCDRSTVYRYMNEIERNIKRAGYGIHNLYARKQDKQQEIHRNNKQNA